MDDHRGPDLELLSLGTCQPLVTLTVIERQRLVAISRPSAVVEVSTDSPRNVPGGGFHVMRCLML